MRFIAFLAATLALFLGALAVDVQKQVIVYYPDSTPDWVVDAAKKTITDAGGVITHEYNLIKAFAATAGEKIIEMVNTAGSQYQALIEEDEVVSVL